MPVDGTEHPIPGPKDEARQKSLGVAIMKLVEEGNLFKAAELSHQTNSLPEICGEAGVTFDPTNRSVGSNNLIPVAVARDIRQAVPVAGSFAGPSDALIGMSVEVSVASS